MYVSKIYAYDFMDCRYSIVKTPVENNKKV